VKIPYIKENLCIHCNICVKVCPRKLFTLTPLGVTVKEHKVGCISCSLCEENCPTNAIKLINVS